MDDVHFVFDDGGLAGSLPFEFGTPGANGPSNRNSAIFVLSNTTIHGTRYHGASVVLSPDYYNIEHGIGHSCASTKLEAILGKQQPLPEAAVDTTALQKQQSLPDAAVESRARAFICLCNASLSLRRLYLWSDAITNNGIVLRQTSPEGAHFEDKVF